MEIDGKERVSRTTIVVVEIILWSPRSILLVWESQDVLSSDSWGYRSPPGFLSRLKKKRDKLLLHNKTTSGSSKIDKIGEEIDIKSSAIVLWTTCSRFQSFLWIMEIAPQVHCLIGYLFFSGKAQEQYQIALDSAWGELGSSQWLGRYRRGSEQPTFLE